MRARVKKILHYLFEAGITIKFVDGILECIAAAMLYFTPLNNILLMIVAEFNEGSFFHIAALTDAARMFLAGYLFLHGIVKVGLVVALWAKKLWAYPLAGILLVAFTIYQGYLAIHWHSLLQLFLTIVDIVILVLLRFEYRRVTTAR